MRVGHEGETTPAVPAVGDAVRARRCVAKCHTGPQQHQATECLCREEVGAKHCGAADAATKDVGAV
eukprot:11211155-Lingulodinium_polyedra.AAC.1